MTKEIVREDRRARKIAARFIARTMERKKTKTKTRKATKMKTTKRKSRSGLPLRAVMLTEACDEISVSLCCGG
jgi:hypothetical protein